MTRGAADFVWKGSFASFQTLGRTTLHLYCWNGLKQSWCSTKCRVTGSMSRKVMAKAWLKKAQAMFFGIKPLLLNELIPLSVKVSIIYLKLVATMLYSVEIWETCQQVQMPLQTLLVDVVRVAAGVGCNCI
jgi:hypothetical protein